MLDRLVSGGHNEGNETGKELWGMVNVKRRRAWALAALAVCGGLLLGLGWYHRHYVFLEGKSYARTTRQLTLSQLQEGDIATLGALSQLEMLDLRGTELTLAQYRELSRQLPGCEILWDVPFQGKYLPQNTTTLEITSLTAEEVEAVTHLGRLRRVDAWDCGDFEALATLSRALPDCQVGYRVPLGSRRVSALEKSLAVGTEEMALLEETLPLLPRVEKLVFTQEPPTGEILRSLEAAFPEMEFSWLYGRKSLPLGSGVEELNLRGGTLTATQAERLLRCCPNLRRMNLQDCGLETGEILPLCGGFSQCSFAFDLTFDHRVYASGVAEMDLTDFPLESTAWLEERMRYMPNLRKVILSGCGLPDEELEAMNQRHPDIQVVWTVRLGPISLRTDATFFAPVVTGQHVNQSHLGALKYCHDLIAIDLGHMPVTDCSWAAYMPKLQYLILADTGVRDLTPLANCGELLFLELFLTPARDYTPLLSCKKLEDLNLCYCRGSVEPIRQMTWLKRLWWDGNETKTRGLAKDLPDTQCNFSSGSSTGGSWRKGVRYKEQRDILGMPYLTG